LRAKQNAAQYVNEDTFTLDPSRSREFFLYKNITRTAKAETEKTDSISTTTSKATESFFNLLLNIFFLSYEFNLT
jgi:hypothetical protein